MRFAYRLSLLAACLTSLAACKDTKAPGCRIAREIPLPATALTGMKNVTLLATGDGFVLAGSDGDDVRWARLGPDGVLGAQSTLRLPLRAIRPEPWLAAAGKNAPGDQLIVIYVAAIPGSPNQLAINAIVQDEGAAPADPKALVDLPAGVDPKIIRLAAAPTKSGQRAAVAWGFQGMVVPSIQILGPGAEPVGAVLKPARLAPDWSCLSLVASRADITLGALEAPRTTGGKPSWYAAEILDTGRITTEITMGFEVKETDCPVAAPTKVGYVLAYQNRDGTFFSDYNIGKAVISSEIVAGVIRFGGLSKMPPLACVSPMGKDFAILYDRSSGPEVSRFDAFGAPEGSLLYLPSKGSISSLSAWPFIDSFYATYLDQGSATTTIDGNNTQNQRHLLKVDCPGDPLAFPPDALPEADGAVATDGK